MWVGIQVAATTHTATGRPTSNLISYLVLLPRNERPRTSEQSPARCLVGRIQDNAATGLLDRVSVRRSSPPLSPGCAKSSDVDDKSRFYFISRSVLNLIVDISSGVTSATTVQRINNIFLLLRYHPGIVHTSRNSLNVSTQIIFE